MAQVLVDRLPADPVVTGKDGFRNTGFGTLEQLGGAFRREGLFPSFVGAALFGQGDALHVIGHLSALLCRLAERNPGPEHVTDDDGRLRVVLSLPELQDLLDVATNQPRQYGASDSAVASRLLDLLHELKWCDRKGTYRREILDHLGRMSNAIEAQDYSIPERASLLEKAESIESSST